VTSKAGIVGPVKCAAHELRPFGVRINAARPARTPVFLHRPVPTNWRCRTRTEPDARRGGAHKDAPDSDGAASISGNIIERLLIPRAGDAPSEKIAESCAGCARLAGMVVVVAVGSKKNDPARATAYDRQIRAASSLQEGDGDFRGP
jgi:NAD(P)-dependent dehydrogenase (short-subunit alcohol dehydrogenase family)